MRNLDALQYVGSSCIAGPCREVSEYRTRTGAVLYAPVCSCRVSHPFSLCRKHAVRKVKTRSPLSHRVDRSPLLVGVHGKDKCIGLCAARLNDGSPLDFGMAVTIGRPLFGFFWGGKTSDAVSCCCCCCLNVPCEANMVSTPIEKY